MKMYHRVGFIVLALFLAAPPSSKLMVAASILFLGIAFLVPNREE